MKFKDQLVNWDIEASMHARKTGLAKIEIYYYGERDKVRKRIVINRQESSEFIDSGPDDD